MLENIHNANILTFFFHWFYMRQRKNPERSPVFCMGDLKQDDFDQFTSQWRHSNKFHQKRLQNIKLIGLQKLAAKY